jgi:teichuronic acid biosynthesis glycosyltransferase TuaC
VKILFFSNEFPRPDEPLRAIFNLRMCQALAARHDVRVFSPIAWTERFGGRDPVPAAGGYGGVPVVHRTYYFLPKVLSSFRGTFMWWSLKRHLRAFTRDWQPDVIVTYWTYPDGETALRLAAELGVPVVQMVGGSDVLLCPRGSRRWRLVQAVLNSAAAVVTMGRHLSKEVVAAGVPSERVFALYRPVDTSHFSPGSRVDARRVLGVPRTSRMVLWVGRFVDVKGVDVLIQAMATLRAGMPDVLLYLVGKGPSEGRIQSLVARAGLSDAVRFVGPVAHAALVCWYRAADVTVLPSLSEGVPNVLLESIACGIPFVASAVGGIPEVADPSRDRLIPPGEPVALADALQDVLEQCPGDATRTSVAATPESFTDQLEAILARVTSADRRTTAAVSTAIAS